MGRVSAAGGSKKRARGGALTYEPRESVATSPSRKKPRDRTEKPSSTPCAARLSSAAGAHAAAGARSESTAPVWTSSSVAAPARLVAGSRRSIATAAPIGVNHRAATPPTRDPTSVPNVVTRKDSVVALPEGRRMAPELDDMSDDEENSQEQSTPEDEDAMAVVHETAEALVRKVAGDAAERSKIKVEWRSVVMREITYVMPFGAKDPEAASKMTKEGGKAAKWKHSHRLFAFLADFLGNMVVLPAARAAKKTDINVDAEVFKLLSCLTESTPLYLRAFFESRRLGHAASGGTTALKMRTVSNDMKPIGHLFARARLPARLGGGTVCPDCSAGGEEFRAKSSSTVVAEQGQTRGTHRGNPMRDLYIKDFQKDGLVNARAAGERPRSNAAVTPLLMRALSRSLVMRHVPVGRPSTLIARTCTNISDIKGDFLRYCVYAFSFMTLARPITTLNLRQKDILPPPRLSPHDSAFNREYVVLHISIKLLVLCCVKARLDEQYFNRSFVLRTLFQLTSWPWSSWCFSLLNARMHAGTVTFGTSTLSAEYARRARHRRTRSSSVSSASMQR